MLINGCAYETVIEESGNSGAKRERKMREGDEASAIYDVKNTTLGLTCRLHYYHQRPLLYLHVCTLLSVTIETLHVSVIHHFPSP